MRISNSWLNQGVTAILSGIQELELNATGGSGSASYRNVVSAKIKLPSQKMTTIVPGTPNLVHREVSVLLLSGSSLSLKWLGMADDDVKFPLLSPNEPLYKDTADGGIELMGYSDIGDCEVFVIVRQQEPITYRLGGIDVANIGVSLWVNTFGLYVQDIEDSSIRIKLRDFIESDNSILGHKLFVINSFTPGKSIKFNIDATDGGYGGEKIEIQLIKPFEVLSLLLKTGLNNFLYLDYATFLEESKFLPKSFTYGGKTDSALGGEIIVKPTLELFVGRFVAKNNFSGVGDTCVITDYQPNIDNPEQGGTFTLKGF
ncbi:MAG: hypothetical protein AAGF85_20855 [Bacteroidota bacterium]